MRIGGIRSLFRPTLTCPGCGAAQAQRCTADRCKAVFVTIPGLQRIIALRFMLRCARDTNNFGCAASARDAKSPGGRATPIHNVKQPGPRMPLARHPHPNNSFPLPLRTRVAHAPRVCTFHFFATTRALALQPAPEPRGGGAPVRYPYILTSPQVAPDYFKCLSLFCCTRLTSPYYPQSTPASTGIGLGVEHARLEQAVRFFRTKRPS
jgi:hypothetical protein